MNSYDAMCNEAVKRFIRTVAIIDDEATYITKLPSRKNKDKKKTVKPPVTSLMTGNPDADSSATKEDSTDEGVQDNHPDSNILDAKAVINAFADMNIACCIQRPKHEEAPLKRALKLAASVDVLVIDWVLDRRNSSLPRDIIKRILEEDKSTGGRMRLVVIYTAQPYIDQMLTDLKEDADAVYSDGLIIDKNRFFIKTDCLRIVILNKKAIVNLPSGARIVPFDQLPDNIISEYVELVRGIIPGATLHGIAAMREKTHKLLSTLNSKLDGAYCLHRALLREPSDSVDFAMNLITNEIETTVQTDAQARKFVDQDGLKAWLKDYSGGKDKLHYCHSLLDVKIVWNCIEGGQLAREEGIKAINKEFQHNRDKTKTKKGQNPKVTRFAEALYDTPTKAISGCRELSRLQCTAWDTVNRPYTDSQHGPTLRLGSVLKARKKVSGKMVDRWYLCLTPLCDCVLLNKNTIMEFLFLRLYPGKKDIADIYIETQKGKFEPLLFKAEKKKFELLTIPFNPGENDRIHTYKWQKQWRVKSDKGNSYQWVAELRYPNALAISHRVAANTSRVGIDEFEWLRRQAP